MTNLQFTPGIDWGYTLSLLGILALLILVAGVWIGRATRRRPRSAPPPHSVPPPMPVHTPPPTPPMPMPIPDGRVVLDRLAAQRAALISGCVRTRGMLDDQLLTEMVDDALRQGGVQIVDPTGQRANSAEHRTAGTDPATAPHQDGVIARTLRPGFIDAGRVVQAADVVVYKWGN